MFKVKKFEIDIGYEYVAMLNEKDALELRLNAKDRVKIINPENDKYVICVLEIIKKVNNMKNKDVKLKTGEIGIYDKAFAKLEIKEGKNVDIVPARKPISLKYVKKKSEGHRLEKQEFKSIMRDIVENRFSEIETTFFVLACTFHKLNDTETIALTDAMVEVGKVLQFKQKIVLDKHCIGGIPNNRTSMLVVPIVSAAGIIIPKSSSRAITSPAGTADTMEVLCNVDIPVSDMYNQVNDIGAAIVWGGGLELSPADDLIIHVEHPLEIDSEGQMIASVLSKKKSVGSTHVLIDIPVGPTAKVKTMQRARELSRRFIKIGTTIGLKIKTIITYGGQPIGNGIGPLYEAQDVLAILENKETKAIDLKEKALKMAGVMLEMAEHSKKGQGYNNAKLILESGLALKKFEDILEKQGKKKIIKEGKFKYEVKAIGSGIVKSINNIYVSKLAFSLGAPQDKAAGLILNKKIKDIVKKGDVLYTIYTNSEMKLKYSKAYLKDNPIYEFE